MSSHFVIIHENWLWFIPIRSMLRRMWCLGVFFSRCIFHTTENARKYVKTNAVFILYPMFARANITNQNGQKSRNFMSGPTSGANHGMFCSPATSRHQVSTVYRRTWKSSKDALPCIHDALKLSMLCSTVHVQTVKNPCTPQRPVAGRDVTISNRLKLIYSFFVWTKLAIPWAMYIFK